jgi:hypothetical protein
MKKNLRWSLLLIGLLLMGLAAVYLFFFFSYQSAGKCLLVRNLTAREKPFIGGEQPPTFKERFICAPKVLILKSGLCSDISWHFLCDRNLYNSANPVTMHASLAANYADDRVLVGASHAIFIGKVLRQVGTKERGFGPETQFAIQIIDNIKGNLKGIVTLDQMGGIRRGVLYITDDGGILSQKDEIDYMLRPGYTYLFATRYNEGENWYTLNSFHTAKKLLSIDENATPEALKTLVESDTRVHALKEAYPHELLFPADVVHGKAFNSYESIQKAQRAAAVEATAVTSDTPSTISDPNSSVVNVDER